MSRCVCCGRCSEGYSDGGGRELRARISRKDGERSGKAVVLKKERG